MDRTWIDNIIAATGWAATERHDFDWAAAEEKLGLRLPTDYKELAEIFGPGMFGAWVGLMLPTGDGSYGLDLLATWSRKREPDMAHCAPLWEPYGLHPKPGGLLEWGYTPDGVLSFYWAVEGADPDRWPVIVGRETDTLFDRYEHTTAEHVYRELTDALKGPYAAGLPGFITLDELATRWAPQ
jgi:hypothetical protein